MKDYSGSSLEEELGVKDAQINKTQLSKVSATMEARSYVQLLISNGFQKNRKEESPEG